jgi:hypothetical protein
MTTMVSILFSGLSFLVFHFGSPQAVTSPAPISICEALENVTKYRGAVLEIRGEWIGGYLIGDCKALRTPHFTWLNAILIELPENVADHPFERVEWKLAREEVDRADRELARLLSLRRDRQKIEATVVGRLDSPTELERTETYGTFQNGYGHLNQYPARMVARTIKDVALSR